MPKPFEHLTVGGGEEQSAEEQRQSSAGAENKSTESQGTRNWRTDLARRTAVSQQEAVIKSESPGGWRFELSRRQQAQNKPWLIDRLLLQANDAGRNGDPETSARLYRSAANIYLQTAPGAAERFAPKEKQPVPYGLKPSEQTMGSTGQEAPSMRPNAKEDNPEAPDFESMDRDSRQQVYDENYAWARRAAAFGDSVGYERYAGNVNAAAEALIPKSYYDLSEDQLETLDSENGAETFAQMFTSEQLQLMMDTNVLDEKTALIKELYEISIVPSPSESVESWIQKHPEMISWCIEKYGIDISKMSWTQIHNALESAYYQEVYPAEQRQAKHSNVLQAAYEYRVELEKEGDFFSEIVNADDFEEKSAYDPESNQLDEPRELVYVPVGMVGDEVLYQWVYTSFDDPYYAAINGDSEAQAEVRLLSQDFTTNANKYDRWFELSPEEVAIYNYIHATEGTDAAKEYMEKYYGEDYGFVESLVAGFLTGTGVLSLVDFIDGVTGNSGVTDHFHKAANANKIASTIGSVGGGLALMLGAGAAVGAGASALGVGSSTLANAGKSAVTFMLVDAVQNAGNVAQGRMDVGDYLKGIGVSGLGGLAGGIAQGLVLNGTAKFLTSETLQKPFAEFCRETLGGMTFAMTNTGVKAVVNGQMLSGEELANTLITSFIYSSLSAAIRTSKATAAAKAELEADKETIGRLMQDAANEARSPEERLAACEQLHSITENARSYVGSHYYAGQQEYVDEVLRLLDTADDYIDMVQSNLMSGRMISDGSAGAAASWGEAPSSPQIPSGNGAIYTGPAESASDQTEIALWTGMLDDAMVQAAGGAEHIPGVGETAAILSEATAPSAAAGNGTDVTGPGLGRPWENASSETGTPATPPAQGEGLGGQIAAVPASGSSGEALPAVEAIDGENARLTDQDLPAYMEVGSRLHVRDAKQDLLNNGHAPILTSPDAITSFIDDSMDGRVQNEIRAYGRVGGRMATDVRAENPHVDISGYYLELDSNHLAHLTDHISAESDARNIPLTREQAEHLPDYLDQYDDVLEVTTKKDGSTRILFGKKIDGHCVIVETVSKGRASLHTKTAWINSTDYYLQKYKVDGSAAPGGASVSIGADDYSQDAGPSENSIAQPAPVVNGETSDNGLTVTGPGLGRPWETAGASIQQNGGVPNGTQEGSSQAGAAVQTAGIQENGGTAAVARNATAQTGPALSAGAGGRWAGELESGGNPGAQYLQPLNVKQLAQIAQQRAALAEDCELIASSALIAHGSESGYVRVIPEDRYDERLKALQDYLYQYGIRDMKAVVGLLQIDLSGETQKVIGYADFSRGLAVIDAGSRKFSEWQSAVHELAHFLETDERIEQFRLALGQHYHDGALQVLYNAYNRAYADVMDADGITDQRERELYVWGEILADAASGRNCHGTQASLYQREAQEVLQLGSDVSLAGGAVAGKEPSGEIEAAMRDTRGSPAYRYALELLNDESDLQKAERLKNASVEIVVASTESISAASRIDVTNVKAQEAASILFPILEEFGIFGSQYNQALEIEFDYSKTAGARSLSHQIEITGRNYTAQALVQANLRELCEKAYPVEAHADEKAGDPEAALKQIITLYGAMQAGQDAVFTKMTIKIPQKESNRLHMVVASEIKKGFDLALIAEATKPLSADKSNPTISIPAFLENVKEIPEFVKRIPVDMVLETSNKSKGLGVNGPGFGRMDNHAGGRFALDEHANNDRGRDVTGPGLGKIEDLEKLPWYQPKEQGNPNEFFLQDRAGVSEKFRSSERTATDNGIGVTNPDLGRVGEGAEGRIDTSPAALPNDEDQGAVIGKENSLADTQNAASENKSGLKPPKGFASVESWMESVQNRQAAAEAQRLAHVMKEDFTGTEALEALGIKIEGSVGLYDNVKQILANDKAAKSVRREVLKAEKRLGLTDAEMEFASGIAAGLYEQADIPNTMEAEKVMELADYYYAEQVTANDLIRKQKAQINRANDQLMEKLFADADNHKPTNSMLILNNRTPERNMRQIFGDELGETVNKALFYPTQTNEAERLRFINRMFDKVRTFHDSKGKQTALTEPERALVQMVIEGKAAAEIAAGMERAKDIQDAAESIANGTDADDAAKEFSLHGDERTTAKRLAAWVQAQKALQSDQVDSVRVKNAAQTYSKLFDMMYEAINDFLVAHGYDPIGYIKGYAPHMQPDTVQSKLSNAFKALGVNTDVSKLPTSIAGTTGNFKPGKRWDPYFLTRTGDKTKFDIATGFESYIDFLSDVLYHTDDILRIRAASRYLRSRYAPEEIRETLSWAKELQYGTTGQKTRFLQDHKILGKSDAVTQERVSVLMDEYVEKLFADIEKTTAYGSIVTYLDNYANILAGKQSMTDRGWEYGIGRKGLNIGNRLMRTFARANVAGSLSSMLNQTAQLPMIKAELGAKWTALAIKDMLSGKLRKMSWYQESDFLTEKHGIDYIVHTTGEMVTTAMFKPAELMDTFVSTLAVRGAYLKALSKGLSHKDAMRAADKFGKEVMGSRAKGSRPLAYESKNPFSQMVHIFQVEAANSWEHLAKDLPRDFREIERTKGRRAAIAALAGVIVKLLLASFVLNRVAEETYGGTPAPFDLLGLTANFIASGEGLTTNQYLRTVIDDGLEKLTGSRLFDTDADEIGDEPFDWKTAFSDLRYNVSNDVPFVRNISGMMGWGDKTLPIPNFKGGIDDLVKAIQDHGAISGESGRALLGLLAEFLPGGRQLKKTGLGLEAVLRGGDFSGFGDDARLKYPIGDDAWSTIQALLFGKYATEESNAYYADGDRLLSVNQTRAYLELVEDGADREVVYRAIQDYRRITGDDDLESSEENKKVAALFSTLDLEDEQKLVLYHGLTGNDSRAEKFRAIMDSGVSFDATLDAFAKYQGIANDDELDSLERGIKERALIAGADLSDEQKLTMYRMFSGADARCDKFQEVMSAGMTFNETVSVFDEHERIDAKDLKVNEKATEYAHWLAQRGYNTKQIDAVQDQFKFWSMYAGEPGKYDSFAATGIPEDVAYRCTEAINALQPPEGKDQVQDVQKWRAVVDTVTNVEQQMQALSAIMSENAYRDVSIAFNHGIKPEYYVGVNEILPQYDEKPYGSYTQKEIKAAIDAYFKTLSGIDPKKADELKAVLWQLISYSSKGSSNPYNTEVGEKVYAERAAAKAGDAENG